MIVFKKTNDIIGALENYGQNSPLSLSELAKNFATISNTNMRVAYVLSDAKFIESASDLSAKNIDDSSWRSVELPYDWQIFNSFSSSSPAGRGEGWLNGGTGWYRIKIAPALIEDGKKYYLYFDGSSMETYVYVNGVSVGQNRYSYNPFTIDITNYLQYDSNDVVSIKCVHNTPASRFYVGSGIYRPLYLIEAESGVVFNNLQVLTPNIENEYNNGYVSTTVSVEISSDTTLAKNITLYIKKDDVVVAKSTKPYILNQGNNIINDTFKVINPLLWEEGNGVLYTASAIADGVSGIEDYFGYRWVKFTKDGFFLNGEKVFLKGVCLHKELGCIGAAVNKSAIERQLDILLKMGCNSIRFSHYPSSSIMLRLCAEKGILVMAEFFDCWTKGKYQNDFHNYFSTDYQQVIENTVKRERNNPSIVIWSLGNEIQGEGANYSVSEFTTILSNIKNAVRALDDRATTLADDRPTNTNSMAAWNIVDVIGVNYHFDKYNSLRESFPNKPIICTECACAFSSRGDYVTNSTALTCSSYDDTYGNGFGSPAAYAITANMKSSVNCCGMYVWTGFDYIGGISPYSNYPAKSTYCGIVDLAGFPKDIYYMYQSVWTTKPMVHILPHWNHSSGNVKVWIYSNCLTVELFLNGQSLGKKTIKGEKYQFEYSVPFSSGTLKAVGYYNGGIVEDEIKTAGAANKISLIAEKEVIQEGDLAFVQAIVLDSNNVLVPKADTRITFSVTNGSIVGLDNGFAASVEPFNGTNSTKAYNGKCICVIKPDENAKTINVSANGGQQITIYIAH